MNGMPSADEAIDIFWGDFEGTEVSGDMLVQSEHSLDSWMWFDYRLPDGGCMLDSFLERDPALSSGQRKYLEQMRETAVLFTRSKRWFRARRLPCVIF